MEEPCDNFISLMLKNWAAQHHPPDNLLEKILRQARGVNQTPVDAHILKKISLPAVSKQLFSAGGNDQTQYRVPANTSATRLWTTSVAASFRLPA